ncbi:MAG: hypothetical protein Q4G43_06595 [Mobilicoccus sp.]|nr:hypothetical protein [Mobilicoccus sp.]
MTVTEYTDQVDALTPETLQELCGLPAPVVSIYLPTRRDNADPHADALRLRGLIDEAAGKLAELDTVAPTEDQRIVAPLRELAEDRHFWSEQADSLALIAWSGGHRIFRLAATTHEQAHVGALPHLAPLVPVAFGDEVFYLLAVSRNAVRLFTGRRDSLHQLDLGPIPDSLENIERQHEQEHELQHQGEPRGGGGVATFHGHGGTDVSEVMVDKFVLEVATGLRSRIGSKTTQPVVLAAVAEYLPKFQATGLLPTLVDDVAAGNPDQLSAADLLEKAWPVVEEAVAAPAARYTEAVAERRGAGTAVVDPAEIARMGTEGRIGTLLLRTGAELDDHEVARLDDAVCSALTTSAEIHAVRDLPENAPYAALLRW